MQEKEILRKLQMPLGLDKPCGGMKKRNENQVGVNQNYQPFKKRTTSK